jgi:glc operon protein GlcG
MHVADSKRLTHQGAKKMMATAIAKAEEAGIAVSVAIADRGFSVPLLRFLSPV